MTVKENTNKLLVKVNILQNRYVTDGNIWTIDETIFNKNTKLFLVLNLKTRAIIGFIICKNNLNEDIIIELYNKIFSQYNENNPVMVHSDNDPIFKSDNILELFANRGIKVSFTSASKNQNQVSESINERIKTLVTTILITNDSKGLRNWRKTVPNKFKYLKISNKSRNTEFRKLLFNSQYFEQKKVRIIKDAILQYNQKDFSTGISSQEAECYNTKLESKTINNLQLVRSDDITALKTKKENTQSIKKVKLELSKVLSSNLTEAEKISEIASLMIEGQSQTNELLKLGFSGLALQNSQLLSDNQQLDDRLVNLQEQLEDISKELAEKKQKEKLVRDKKIKRKNRKRLPKREPITTDIYQFLIDQTNTIEYYNLYTAARLRLALTLLVVTGIRISERLRLKMGQIQTLFSESWIAIDRSKRGPSSHKAFLTREGVKLIKDRGKDFEFLSYYKQDNSYIFTSQYSNKPLERESFTNLINKFIKQSAKEIEGQPVLSSHSFRIGFISKLWRDTSVFNSPGQR
jgi:integrase